jgi:triacylglycerol lipase
VVLSVAMNIVLVHGILGFRERFGFAYFRGVAEHLAEKGFNVAVPQLDPTQGIKIRAAQLQDQINQALANGSLDPTLKTHIIAHSMGGLDSRWMLSPANPNRIRAAIRSLTTVSTPHRGSPVADLIDCPEKLSAFGGLPFGLIANPLQPVLEALGISLNGLRDLTTKSCQDFNATCTDNEAVAYFSVAGVGRLGFPETAAVFLLFHKYISALTNEPNDGMVTVRSAQWGTFDPTTWPADHGEEVGNNINNLLSPPAFPWLAKYDQIVSKLTGL